MIIQHKKTPKKALISLAAVLCIATAVGLYYWQTKTHSNATTPSTINENKPTTEQIKAGQNAKDATVKGTTQDTGNLEKKETLQPDNTAVPQVSITAASQNGDIVQVRSLISAVTTTGTCTLTLTNGSHTVTKTAAVQALADSATCRGFDIPTSEFTVKGMWTIALTYTNSAGSTRTTQNITIN